MPGLTAPLTEPYDAAINTLLNRISSGLSDEAVVQQLEQPEKHNVLVLETAFRDNFYRILASYDIDDDGFQRMWDLLDIVNAAADARICDPGFLFVLVEELLDSQTIHGCRKVFDYLELRRERLIANNWVPKNLAVLRSCNELLRRLSRAEDTVFCGRVFIFLFQSFPLGDKSSVNLRGEYHTDNVTKYEQEAKESADAEAMVVDTVATTSTPAAPTIKVDGGETIDTSALYSTFWSLQEFFSQPTKLFDTTNLESFKSGLESTMKKFKEVYKDEPRAGTRLDEHKGIKRKLDNLDGNAFNPKYLTSRDMFELEIHDSAFRRHILVQSLIVADFLLSQTPKAKARLENMKNKAVVYDFTLDDKNVKWATDMRTDIAGYLQQGNEGKFYYRMVDNVLSRDKNWLRWKAESCPPFQLDPVRSEVFDEARVALQKVAAPRQIRKPPMGALDLGFLEDDSQTDPLEKYRNSERWSRPDLLGFRDQIANVEMDLEMADDKEKEELEEQKSSTIWRALRVGGRFGLLDKLDMDDRDGLDPLFGIVKEPVDGEVGEEDEKGEEDGDNGPVPDTTATAPAQLDGMADERNTTEAEASEVTVPEKAQEDEGEEQADAMEVQEMNGGIVTEGSEHAENADEDLSAARESRSIESSLSPPPSIDAEAATPAVSEEQA